MYSQRNLSTNSVFSRAIRGGRPAISRAALAALIAVGLAIVSRESFAAPVTFRFEAEVTVVNGSADEIVQIVPGDIVEGRFTYEPAPQGSEGLQNNELRFEVNGLVLSSDVYDLFIQNNAGGVAGPLVDVATILCSVSGANVCNPEHIAGTSDWTWEPSIVFEGNIGVLTSDELTKDVNWNGFESKRLGIRLVKQSTTDRLTFQATIGSVLLVPEPTSFLLSVVGFVIAILPRRASDRSGRQRHSQVRLSG